MLLGNKWNGEEIIGCANDDPPTRALLPGALGRRRLIMRGCEEMREQFKVIEGR